MHAVCERVCSKWARQGATRLFSTRPRGMLMHMHIMHPCTCPPPMHAHCLQALPSPMLVGGWSRHQSHAISRMPPTPSPATTCAGTSVSHAPSPPCHRHIGAHPWTPTHPNTHPFTYKLCDTTHPCTRNRTRMQARLSLMLVGGRGRHQSHANSSTPPTPAPATAPVCRHVYLPC